MAVLVVVRSSITGYASVCVSCAKRVPGLDGTVSADVLDVSGCGAYQIVTDLDGNRIGLWKTSIRRKGAMRGRSI